MRRYLPIALLLFGVLTAIGAFVFVRSRKPLDITEEDEIVAEVPLNLRPVTSLTPSEDGHFLNMKIESIKVSNAVSMDYEILYKVEDGRIQGVPGIIELDGQTSVEREILLGSESSGKFRYDEGVETGSLTLRFRNENGKLVGKLSTDFHLLSDTDELTSLDESFSFTLDEESDEFFIVMETFGLPEAISGEIVAGPYGVFGSDDGFSGEVEMEGKVFWWDGGEWEEVEEGVASDIGIFIGVSGE